MVPIAVTTSMELRQNWVMPGLILRTVAGSSDFCHSAKGTVGARLQERDLRTTRAGD